MKAEKDFAFDKNVKPKQWKKKVSSKNGADLIECQPVEECK